MNEIVDFFPQIAKGSNSKRYLFWKHFHVLKCACPDVYDIQKYWILLFDLDYSSTYSALQIYIPYHVHIVHDHKANNSMLHFWQYLSNLRLV